MDGFGARRDKWWELGEERWSLCARPCRPAGLRFHWSRAGTIAGHCGKPRFVGRSGVPRSRSRSANAYKEGRTGDYAKRCRTLDLLMGPGRPGTMVSRRYPGLLSPDHGASLVRPEPRGRRTVSVRLYTDELILVGVASKACGAACSVVTGGCLEILCFPCVETSRWE